MEINGLHSWQVSYQRTAEIQRDLAVQVLRRGVTDAPRFIAGVDISVGRGSNDARGAVVVLDYPGLRLVESKVLRGRLDFPYIPGLLSFREAPLILEICSHLNIIPDLILVDGQGIAHPRRLGLASHLGLFLDAPTIGCAKSRLCGQHETPGTEAGNYTELTDKRETIGAVVRTKSNTRPIYVSIGHRIDLKTAVSWVLRCCHGYRLPEPTRLAHLAAGGNLRETQGATEQTVR